MTSENLENDYAKTFDDLSEKITKDVCEILEKTHSKLIDLDTAYCENLAEDDPLTRREIHT